MSSLTFTQKRVGGLRVCLDPKNLNRAVKRTHHKTSTLEEITHQFSAAKVFSKLDAKNGYLSVRLDEPSSILPCFRHHLVVIAFADFHLGWLSRKVCFNSVWTPS
jgi:hypothetical protein